MATRTIVGIVAAVAVMVLISASTFVVREDQQVLITEFGKIQGKPKSRPGLHFKVPFIQEVRRFDKRWLEWDGVRNEIPTKDKKYIWVDTFARWRIADPVLFYQSLREEQRAQSRLDDIIDGEIRNIIARHALIEIVRNTDREFEANDDLGDNESETTEEQAERGRAFAPQLGRNQLMAEILEKASRRMPEYGVELADVRIKRINYVASVQDKVFERMVSERQRIAERFRSEGQGISAEITGRIEREVRTIQSEGYRKAQEVRGKADAEAAGIYAAAYNRNPQLYRLLKSLDSYRAFIDKNTDVLLSTDSEALEFLSKSK